MNGITNCNITHIATVTASDGTVFDLIDQSCGDLLITDYIRLKKKIIPSRDGKPPKLAEEKKRLQIKSIDDLRDISDQCISIAQQIYMYYFSIDFSDIDKNLLAEQLIFDILFNKYMHESEEMTLHRYSNYIKNKLDYEAVPDTVADRIRNGIKRRMKNYSDKIRNSPQLQEELTELGVDPSKYISYYCHKAEENLKKKKPVYVWDRLFYNQYMKITSRQYRRQLKEDGNYSCETFVEELKNYRSFVKKMLPAENESPKKYFEKSMDYYCLESYKRIDFIFKLMNVIPKFEAKGADYAFLVKRFTPAALVPYENKNNGQLDYTWKCNYYTPLFMIEDELHKQIQKSDGQSHYSIRLSNHQFIRAKAYELIKYHIEYKSSDYADIKNFISKHYNMISYFQSNEIWNKLPDKPWRELDKETQMYFRALKKKFIQINDSLFPASPKGKPTI